MPEPKSQQIMTNLEATFYDIMGRLLTKEHMTASAYIRRLIVADLIARGLVTDEMMQNVLTGSARTVAKAQVTDGL